MLYWRLMASLVQLLHPAHGRAVALVDDHNLQVLTGIGSAYDLAQEAIQTGTPLARLAEDATTSLTLNYEHVLGGKSEWSLLPAFDHPAEPGRCHVTGTGLTHMASVETRQAMHAAGAVETDSMRMYKWGEQGGRPMPGSPGTSPEWFYKGNGLMLAGHNQPLEVPWFAEDGGEEGEIAGIYLIDNDSNPRRAGMAQGNEFSDHVFEKKNYLYLASSKIRQCSIGPELKLDPDFGDVAGSIRVLRGADTVWEKPVRTGEANMCHSLENMEHHHFKFPLHCRPGDVHIHFYGASAFSFGAGMKLQDGDVMEISYEGFGKPLRNPLRVAAHDASRLVKVRPL